MLRVIRKGLTFFVLVAMILSIASCGGGIPIVPNDPPVIQKVDGPDGGAVINQAAALFEWAGEDTMGARTIERYEIKKDSGTWQANTPITSTTYAWNNITEGTRSFSVRAVDDRGDVSNVLTWNFNYTIPEYTLTVQASPTAGGDIQIAAQGWQDTDTITVDENSQVQIQAQAANGYAFNGWYEGGLLLSQDNPLTVMVDTHRTVQAQFDDVPNTPPIVQKVDGPPVLITINHATFEWTGADAINTRAIVKYQYQKDAGAWTDMDPLTQTTYTWNNIAEGDHTFSVKAFDDEDAQSDPVTWNFNYTIPEYTLTVQASPTAGGDIQIAAQGWQDTDTITVDENTQVVIHAQPADGYAFDGWFEGQTLLSQQTDYTVSVNSARTLTGIFTLIPNPLPIVQKVDGPPALITINHATFEWTGSDEARAIEKYQYQKDAGAWTDMDPLTQTTYTWNNIAEGDHTFSVKAFDDEDAQSDPVTWNFNYTIPEYTLTVQASPTAGGDIQIAAQGWQDTDTITVDENTQVDLTAQATEGYVFEGWYEGQTLLSQQTTYTATVDANKTIWAYFKQLTRLRELGPEGNTNEPGNVYNIINNTFMGFWSVSVRISELPAEFQGATGWKLIVLGEEFEFTPNFVTADIYETNVEDTVTNNIEDIRNAFFVAEF